MCSSTPSIWTPVKRAGSTSAPASSGKTGSHTVRQPVPNCRRRPLTEACSRRSCSIAHRQALVVSVARGAATRSSCPTNVVTGQAGLEQIQRR